MFEKKAKQEQNDDIEEREGKEKRPVLVALRPEIKVGLLSALVIIIVGILFGTHTLCVHSWNDASCLRPRTCGICGVTEGKALGHKWMSATCEDPTTCVHCGKEKDKALGHIWSEATCAKPAICKRCGETEGTALGHDVQEWTVTKEARCTEEGQREGTCSRCGETQVEQIAKLDHTPGDWQITQDVIISSSGYVTPGTQEQKCTVCGTTLNTQPYTVQVSTSQRNALLKASSYLRMGGFSYQSLKEQLEFEGFSSDDSAFACDHCGADWDYQVEIKAASYMRLMGFSRSSLIEQLQFEGFTTEQAAHGADSVGL